MTAWTEDELARIGRTEQLQVSSYRADGALRPYVTIWTVRPVHATVDAAYHTKYDRYGASIVGSVTGSHTVGETFRLIPRA
jgi:hypothetical protein